MTPRSRLVSPRFLAGVGLAAVLLACIQAALGAPVGFDTDVLQWFVLHRAAALDTPMEAISAAFAPGPAIVLAVIVAAVLVWRLRDWRPGVQVLASSAVTMMLVVALKLAVDRGRPPLASQLGTETDASFPSGHVAGILVLAVSVCVALWPRLTRARRAVAVALSALLVAVVAVSRLYLAAHWGTDVVAGLALAGMASLFLPQALTAWLSQVTLPATVAGVVPFGRESAERSTAAVAVAATAPTPAAATATAATPATTSAPNPSTSPIARHAAPIDDADHHISAPASSPEFSDARDKVAVAEIARHW